jgi:transposase
VGRSRGGLTTKIHARVDGQGRPIKILITPGQAHDLTAVEPLLANLKRRTIIIADKAYDADRVRAHIKARGAVANIPNMSRRKRRFRWKKALYRQRNLVERFFNKLKQFRRIATRYDKLGDTFLAFLQLAVVRISIRSIESTPFCNGPW